MPRDGISAEDLEEWRTNPVTRHVLRRLRAEWEASRSAAAETLLQCSEAPDRNGKAWAEVFRLQGWEDFLSRVELMDEEQDER